MTTFRKKFSLFIVILLSETLDAIHINTRISINNNNKKQTLLFSIFEPKQNAQLKSIRIFFTWIIIHC